MTQETRKINNLTERIKMFWFVDKCYFIGSATPSYFIDHSSTLIITAKYGYDIIRFDVDKCAITGELDFLGALNKAIKYFNPFRVLYLNVKTFFVGLIFML